MNPLFQMPRQAAAKDAPAPMPYHERVTASGSESVELRLASQLDHSASTKAFDLCHDSELTNDPIAKRFLAAAGYRLNVSDSDLEAEEFKSDQIRQLHKEGALLSRNGNTYLVHPACPDMTIGYSRNKLPSEMRPNDVPDDPFTYLTKCLELTDEKLRKIFITGPSERFRKASEKLDSFERPLKAGESGERASARYEWLLYKRTKEALQEQYTILQEFRRGGRGGVRAIGNARAQL